MLTPDEWVALIGAITLLIGAVAAAIVSLVRAGAEAAKTRAEVAAMRKDIEMSRAEDAPRRESNDRLIRETHHQVIPNSGGSIIDATNRLEKAVDAIREAQSLTHTRLEQVEQAQQDAAKDVRGMRRDVGRLADADHALTARADREHERLHQRITGVERLVDPHVD
ncbi:MAG: hypothetical protein Q4G35_14330 [Propionibacteriaceae bacterium]|nr:hypothetical protein [Propionibacteriaceae bacterium]